jgi:hypothetical protein
VASTIIISSLEADSSPAASVIEPDAVVRSHTVQMPTVHNLTASTVNIMAIKVHGVAATIRIQTSGTAVAAALARSVTTFEINLDSPAPRTPAASASATIQLPVAQCFVATASNIMAVQVHAFTSAVVVQACRLP